MPQYTYNLKAWADRLRAHQRTVKRDGLTWRVVASKLPVPKGRPRLTEGAVRHWLNGTNEITLRQFFELCNVLKADAHDILFGRLALTPQQRRKAADEVVHLLDEIKL